MDGNYKDYNRKKLVIILPQEGWFCKAPPAGCTGSGVRKPRGASVEEGIRETEEGGWGQGEWRRQRGRGWRDSCPGNWAFRCRKKKVREEL